MRRPDEGRVLLLVLVYTLISAALVLVVTSAASVHLTRHRLQTVADAAALDAADALDATRFYRGGAGPDGAPVPLSSDTVADSVTAYLSASGAAGRFQDLAVAPSTGSPDGTTAEVTLVAVSPPPPAGRLLASWSDGVPVTVTGRARARSTP